LRRAQKKRMMASAQKGRNLSVELSPVDRGNLQRSIFEPEWRGNKVVWGSAGVGYARAQEEGTAPFTPDLRALLEWGDRKFSPSVTADEIMQEIQEQGMHPGIFRHPGAAVWDSIREHGIKAKHFLRDGAKLQKDEYRQTDLEDHLDD